MGKKLDAALTVFCLLTIVLMPVLRSGDLPQVWEQITQFDLTEFDLRGVFGLVLLGVQMISAFWFACFAKHYVSNMLIAAVLVLVVIAVRKMIQKKTGEVY